MAIQRISVDLIPGAKVAPVINASQYDNGRQFEIELLNGGEAFTPTEGMTIELHVKKRDDTIIINSPVNRTNNIITFSTTEQMTACHGHNVCEVSISDGGLLIGTANFILDVEKDPIEGGLTSESEIDNLTQQIEDITQEVIGEDYYNKTETDALLADKADISDLATLASKAELTQAISDEDTAVKNWVSSNFATPGYVATHYYSKLQVDDIINNMLPVGSASGNPCIFDTEYPYLIQGLKAEIVSGGGNGTPTTPNPIVGHSELNLTRCGANFTDISDNTTSGAGYIIGGFPVAINADNVVLPSGIYVFSFAIQNATYPCACQLIWYRNGVEVGNTVATINSSGINSIAFTASGEFDSFVMFCNSSSGGAFTNFNLNIGSTATAYEPYNGQTFTIAFGQTVYGGLYDKNGRLNITWGAVDLGSLDWDVQGTGTDGGHIFAAFGIDRAANASGLCSSMEVKNFSSWSQTLINTVNLGHSVVPIFASSATITDKDDFKTAMSGVILAYELATPIVIDVPSISVFAENGVNNIVSDCIGDVNVSYKDTIQHYIDSRI